MFERITLPGNLLHPVSPYCHAVRAGEFLFVTGQLAQEPSGTITLGAIADQTHRVMQNLKLVLDHCGTGFDRVTMARIFLTDIRDIDTVNEIYRSYFQPDQLPGRTTIGVTGWQGWAILRSIWLFMWAIDWVKQSPKYPLTLRNKEEV